MAGRRVGIVVVGAGPAGLSAAEAAARCGADVLILEREAAVGVPTRTSGGSFIADLQELGIPSDYYHPVACCRFWGPSRVATFEFTIPVFAVLDVRRAFQYLAERAVAAGARLQLATTVVVPLQVEGWVVGVRARRRGRGSADYRAGVVIDASGYKAAIATTVGLHASFERFGVGAEVDLYAPHYDEQELALIVGSQIAPTGYAWAFPYGGHRVRVGVGVIHPDTQVDPWEYLDRLLAQAHRWGLDLRGAQPIEIHHGLIPAVPPPARLVMNGLMAVGDAAAQASTLVGEGIRFAIWAGRFAGRVAATAIARGDVSATALKPYQRSWQARYGRMMHRAYMVNQALARLSDAQWDRAVGLLGRLSAAQFARYLHDGITIRAVLGALVRDPRIALRVISVLLRGRGHEL